MPVGGSPGCKISSEVEKKSWLLATFCLVFQAFGMHTVLVREIPSTEELAQEMNMVTTTKTTTTEAPEFAQTIRDEMVSNVKQAEKISLDATKTFMKAVSALRVPGFPTLAGVAEIPSAEALTNYTFNLVADLLNAQRDFAFQLATVLSAEKTA
jgi:hypothetical protein